MDFYNAMNNTTTNLSKTENGALGYKTSGKTLVDFLFSLSSLRGKDDDVKAILDKVITEDADPYILKFIYYIRDVREGLGEINTFIVCIKELLTKYKYLISDKDKLLLLKLIPEYGKWKDLIELLDSDIDYKTEDMIMNIINDQVHKDITEKNFNRPISLLTKWMPSINTSSAKSRKLAIKISKFMNISFKQYRKFLSEMRSYLDVVECKLCSNRWGEVNYNTVPSKANLKYMDAFLKHDETRRRQYLRDLDIGHDSNGNEIKINSSVNFPHEVLHKYKESSGWFHPIISDYDETIEQLWKNLKVVDGLNNTIVVRDDSGSMSVPVTGSNITALEIATALSIYTAEHNEEPYKNKIISFSSKPKYLDFSDPMKFGSLHSKYEFLNEHSEVSNTNIEKVFDLILNTAIENKLDNSQLPKQILILSDMEFDDAIIKSNSYETLFKTIENKYNTYGYKLPKLIFWNLLGRTKTVPMKENENGVLLVSGFSQNILNMVLNGELDPYKALIKELNKSRYNNIPLLNI